MIQKITIFKLIIIYSLAFFIPYSSHSNFAQATNGGGGMATQLDWPVHVSSTVHVGPTDAINSKPTASDTGGLGGLVKLKPQAGDGGMATQLNWPGYIGPKHTIGDGGMATQLNWPGYIGPKHAIGDGGMATQLDWPIDIGPKHAITGDIAPTHAIKEIIPIVTLHRQQALASLQYLREAYDSGILQIENLELSATSVGASMMTAGVAVYVFRGKLLATTGRQALQSILAMGAQATHRAALGGGVARGVAAFTGGTLLTVFTTAFWHRDAEAAIAHYGHYMMTSKEAFQSILDLPDEEVVKEVERYPEFGDLLISLARTIETEADELAIEHGIQISDSEY